MTCFMLIGLLILYIMWDINYFTRFVWTIGLVFRKKVKITQTTTINGIVTTQDVDNFIWHMNNSRYLRELDFARYHYYGLTGFSVTIMKNSGTIFQSASNIRYRREIRIFKRYRIETKLIWWDDKAIYLEQKFITVADNFVRAIVMSKQSITKVNVMDLMKQFPECKTRPKLENEFKLWLGSIEASSKKLRAAD